MTLYHAILSIVMAYLFGAANGAVALIVLRKPYDKAAEELENLTAEEAQAFADVFSKIAQRLKAPRR